MKRLAFCHLRSRSLSSSMYIFQGQHKGGGFIYYIHFFLRKKFALCVSDINKIKKNIVNKIASLLIGKHRIVIKQTSHTRSGHSGPSKHIGAKCQVHLIQFLRKTQNYLNSVHLSAHSAFISVNIYTKHVEQMVMMVIWIL